MHVQKVRNVCQALKNTVDYLNRNGEFEDSRNGRVLVSPQPICTVTSVPQERVLFSAYRDANPFFHMFEAIWMLSGEDKATVLDLFIKEFSNRYAERDGVLHGAYGARWRWLYGYDQLDFVVQKLIAEPHTRQCVISMWDAHGDRCDDLRGVWKDRPCNDVIFLRNNDGALDITICCRSNDMLWGAHGANAVHFSILQEYLAARIDLAIGHMYQISNNAHVYLDQFNKLIARASPEQILDNRYTSADPAPKPLPMFTEPAYIDEDIHAFMKAFYEHRADIEFHNPWFLNTLIPAMGAHEAWKRKDYKNALLVAGSIEAPDWRIACEEWIERRMPNV
jgi:thymidylate synthase